MKNGLPADKNNLHSATIDAFRKLQFPWQIFQWNAEEIRNDFELLTRGRSGNPVALTNNLIAPQHIFLEEGVTVEYATINASGGPVYIGRNATIMEGALIRGPFALGENSLIKMGATIYSGTTIGPYCVAGGEIKNSVLFGYSNKSHEGYLGDSVIGEWCNLGAGTSNSNLKNNAGAVQIWNEPRKEFLSAGTKCGMLMGDYSRAAINTSFNTGTVTGVSANVFGTGLTPHYIPSFSWGYTHYSKYRFEKAIEDIANWKRLKNQSLSDIEIRTLKHIFEND